MKNNTTSAARPMDLASGLSGLFRPSVIVGVFYVMLTVAVAINNHYTLLDFVHIGTVWANHIPSGSWGYDGQYYYQMARDFLQSYQYMDNAPFREQHIFYPMVVGVLSFGQVTLIPVMLLLVNLASIILSVEILARLLAKYDFSPWFSLAFGLYCGQAAGLLFDTAEPFTYFLVCAGVWFVLEKQRYWPAAILLGLAALTRELAILFPLGFICVFVVQRKWQACALFVAVSLAPLLLWLLALRLVYGQTGVTFTQPFEHVPFAGVFFHSDAPKKFYLILVLMFLPTLAGWIMAAVELYRKVLRGNGPFLQRFSAPYLILLANLLMITLLNHHSFDELVSCTRIATGLVLSVLLYAFSSRQKWILWGAQFYTATILLYVAGTLLHWPSFLS